MTLMEEVKQSTNLAPDHLLDWLNDSVSIHPSVQLDESAYAYQWWEPPVLEQADDHLIIENPQSAVDATNCDPNASEIVDPGAGGGHYDNPVSKKRKPTPRSANQSQSRRNLQGDDDCPDEEQRIICVNRRTTQNGKRPPGAKNGSGGGGGGGGGNGSKDARWAEQLLNPCAEAIAAGNVSRVQHYFCVLQELASVSGDANYRLAAHGLRALTRHLSGTAAAAFPAPPVFAATEPKLFHDSLIRFNELSPWFSFPNAMANASILHTLSSEPYKDRASLRIIDIGVSHGMQWPTLLEALTRRPGGPPSLVRLTVVPPPPTMTSSTSEEEGGSPAVPFSVGPPGDDFPSRLLRFAKRIDLNLQIDEGSQAPEALLPRKDDETLVVCAQFRLHQLGHGGGGDERGEFLRGWGEVGPDLVVLSEDEGESGCAGEDYGARFARRAESLWRFLDSTSAAFKGRECPERRVVEGEAARLLAGAVEAKEGRAGWCGRMRTAGFVAEDFGEDAVDGGRALLRKYDGSWEMRMDGGGVVFLCWKGHPVSFCSLWKVPVPPVSASSAATPP